MADNFQSAVANRGNNQGGAFNTASKSGREMANEFGISFADAAKENFTKMAGYAEDYYNSVLALAEKSDIKKYQEQMKNEKLSAEERLQAEKNFNQEKEKIERQALRNTLKLQENESKKYEGKESARLKAQRNKRAAVELRSHQAELEKKFRLEYEAAAGDAKKQAELREKYKLEKDSLKTEIEKTDEEVQKYDNKLSNKLKKVFNVQSSEERDQEYKNKSDQRLAELDAIQERLDNIALTYNDLDEEQQKTADKEEANLRERQKQLEKEKELAEKTHEAREQALKQYDNDTQHAYEQAFSLLTENVGKVNSRLQGSGLSWASTTNRITTNLAINPFIKTESVIRKLIDATEKGIAYNIEQRAFLATISDKIASTFDAFDSSLLRLIRLQQADSTAARLGMDARLTKFFNSMYEDTSYLKNLSGSIAGAIIDAQSQMDRNAAAEFEYTVQKWLGSLSSLGMGDSTITNIAQGLNYLATGDVTSLSSNTSLQTLFAMSANRAGLNYAQLLTSGLTADNTNKLLKSMVSYLKEIAENSDNQVVKGAYGNIFGMSLSDFRSITNLSENDISSIAETQMSYSNMMNEINNQLSFINLASRSNISEMLNTAYTNALFAVANDFTSNPALYAMRQTLMFLSGQKTDIAIPFVSAAGFGLDLNATVVDLANMALGITQGLGLAINILEGLGAKGGLDLNSWNAKETTSRGNIGNLLTTVIGGTSTSSYISNTNQSDIKNQTLSQATDDAESTKQITNKNTKDDAKSAESAYEALSLASSKHGNGNEYFWVKDKLLTAVYDTANEGSLRVIDRAMLSSFTRVFGDTSVVTNGSVKTILGYMADTNSIPVRIVDAKNATFRLTDADLQKLTATSNTPQTVTISPTSSSVKINSNDIRNGVREALLEILGESNNTGENKLLTFLTNATNDAIGLPIKVTTDKLHNGIDVHVTNTGYPYSR